ncbi:MAG: phosphoribosylaminoimidazolesuccinocarboxamide synthase [Polyangia bacterium]
MKVTDDLLRSGCGHTLAETHGLDALGTLTRGKVRDSYSKDGVRTLVVTDRISAFDVVLGTIPYKGQVLNQLAAHWFGLARTAGLPTHVLDVPDPSVTRAVECQPLPVEFVMRSYLTGVTSTSIWRHYEDGKRTFAGHALPDGMKKNQPLQKAILTPSTKAEHGGHDETVSRDELLAKGSIDAATFDEAAEMCATLFALGQKVAAEQGLILADTKYEIGRAPDGSLVFIDEIHTPDSSRYWHKDGHAERMARGEEPRSLDKEYVRRWLTDVGYRGDGPPPPLPDDVRVEAARRYISAYELVTGRGFDVDPEPPLDRIRRMSPTWPALQRKS